MDAKDVAKVPTEGFDKKWWQKHRSIKANGSGVGKALDAWNAAGLPPKGSLKDFEKMEINTSERFAAAFKAVADLEAALKKARGKAKSAKDTIAAIDVYEKEVAKHKASLETLYKKRCKDCLDAKKNFAAKTGERLKQYESDLKDIEKRLVQASSMEKAAEQAFAAGNTDEIDRYAANVQALVQQAEDIYDKMKSRFEQYKKWDTEQKGPSEAPKCYGVMEKDSGPSKKYMAEATDNIFNTTTAMNNARSRIEELKDHLDGIQDIAKRASRSAKDWAKMLVDLKAEAMKPIDRNSGGSGAMILNAKKNLGKLNGYLSSKTPLTEADRNDILVILQSLKTDAIRMPRFVPVMAKVMKRKDRIPQAIQDDPRFKQTISEIEGCEKQLQEDIKLMGQIETMTKKLAAALEKKMGAAV